MKVEKVESLVEIQAFPVPQCLILLLLFTTFFTASEMQDFQAMICHKNCIVSWILLNSNQDKYRILSSVADPEESSELKSFKEKFVPYFIG